MPRAPRNRPARLAGLFGLLLLVAGAAFWFRHRAPASPPSPSRARPPAARDDRQLLAELRALEARERQMDETVWAPERRAERHGRLFVRLWDALNHGDDDATTLAAFPLETIRLPRFGAPETLPHGIRRHRPAGEGRALSAAEWRAWARARAAEGWRLEHVEFRHHQFDLRPDGAPARSVFAFRAHLFRPARAAAGSGSPTAAPELRVLLTGRLNVEWAEGEAPAVRRLDASDLTLLRRAGPPPFRRTLFAEVAPPPKSFFTDPLIVRDLDGDGAPEIILTAANQVFFRRAGKWVTRPLCDEGPGLIFTAVMSDFDGDGRDDLLVARFGGLFLFSELRDGRFVGPARQVWTAAPRLRYGQVLTCGDLDGDGDLDVWLGQYKNPYDGGQMPTPYYDANDGHPDWLLLNDGHGRFTDVTEARGLAAHRFRRTYGGSFVDADADGDLDLLVVSDFSGVALYANDGRGFFRDVTAERFDEPKGFGMAHAAADFDRDGRLDLLVTGMRCPTALRLAHLGLSRPGFPEYARMAPRMTAGCRLYAGDAAGRFRQSPLVAGVANAGWAWGPAAFDLENDGFLEVCIGNGHETRQSAGDYDPEFWLHDIYVADSRENPLLAAYFASKFSRTRGQGMSYGGYHANRLWLNLSGRRFTEAAWLLGVAVEQDSRNVIAADVDGDGRQDLVVTTFETWPAERQTVRVFRNEIPDAGHWIAFRVPVPGACVTLFHGGRVDRRWILTGDSHRAEAPPVAHFGLGAETAVDAVEVTLPGGRVLRREKPAVDRTHSLPWSLPEKRPLPPREARGPRKRRRAHPGHRPDSRARRGRRTVRKGRVSENFWRFRRKLLK